ncbi:putative glycosyl hydrolase [Oceaniovalibus guishaninsula JLT2003]|uniref:Putative glycosyl hydrolase n=1 Tax=Oceaniovalibus guishaninsula JLT2003 TaxID=1231392 RepID=K2HE53_9RHOB|nr:malto-oligosyltrehalose synthase [Oceaniovalibus guishaninsula]EKE44817.1 putative glycosyl hydrolase [Oceaniovalibus guishaninsula JLT2003]
MTPRLTATYRMQLRGGVDFARAEAFLPWIADCGISHLYLSPIFTATEGSTHGYDITDPNEVDPALGGMPGFDRLARAARDHGLGIIVDVVPNHTSFTMENPWLRDVLRHGPDSRYARYFDIDWDAGPLVLPVLPRTFEEMLEAGEMTVEGDEFVVGEQRFPLRARPDPVPGDADGLRALHEDQFWRLAHWRLERDGVTHRRFFTVTGLIGMRVEDQAVFEGMHRLLFELIDQGLVQGVRLDHVDGLADPTAYLRRLRARLPDTPIWVEKILTGDEPLPDWPVEGTTGYEAGRQIAMVLTDAVGLYRVVAEWKAATGYEGTFDEALEQAKGEVIRQELAAELHQLIGLAEAAATARGADRGAETLREAVLALLSAFPRYRTYFAPGVRPEGDVALMRQVADRAAEPLRFRDTVDLLTDMIVDGETGQDRAFAVRFQQVTGALLAKAHEDTAGFRWNGYLAANEVGADPGHAVATPEDVTRWARDRAPHALTLTSSHDTKRSEDARMRMVAISHAPDAFGELWTAAEQADDVSANRRWYLLQCALSIWDADDPDLIERLRDHTVKAMREAKLSTNWIAPDEAAEAAAMDWVTRLVEGWREDEPDALRRLVDLGARLSLAQVALKMTMPGVPDIYQGCIGAHFALTDPDNRRPVPIERLPDLPDAAGFEGAKARLSRRLLHLRRARPDFFDGADFALREGDGTLLEIARQKDGQRLYVVIDLGADDLEGTVDIRSAPE